METIEINPQFEQVLRFINQTNQPVFLTGKAGTGKTTLLKYIRKNTFKQVSVIAPTGVAAINAGGSTIHSFFQFPFTPFLPSMKENGEIDPSKSNLPSLKYNSQRLAIFRNLELLVIDEISMVRADMLDQIDLTLRQTRKKWHQPFGGVQVLLIGDMYQLPPVVQQEEWKMLNDLYKSPYFFESFVVRRNPPVYIELDKIYRQSEETFIGLLNKVRNNNLDLESLDLLNSHYNANITQQDYKDNITLTTHNRKADEINSKNLNMLSGSEHKFRCKVDGIFSDKNYPADEQLVLKKGTRVMFLKNNAEKNYYNGKIGVVSFIDNEKIKVKCDEDNYEIEVGKEQWTNVSYKLDKSSKHIDEEILGTFSQYPLRLAWAITIHKSQGLTFDKLIIDAAESFSAGQVYVALSRCRSLKGLTLSSRIGRNSLMNDNNILNFSSTRHDNEQVNTIFSSAQRNYIKTVLVNLFDFTEQVQNRHDLAGIIQMYNTRINREGTEWAASFFSKLDALNEVSGKFKNQLSDLIDRALSIETDMALQARIKQASVYFEGAIKICLDELKNCSMRTESKEAANEFNELAQVLADALYFKYVLIKSCSRGFNFSDFIKHKLQLIYPDLKINIYASAKNTKVSAEVKHPDLYRHLLLLRDEICHEESKPIYMVANNKTLIELTNFLPDKPGHLLQISGFGSARAEAYGERFLTVVKEYMMQFDLRSAMDAKAPKSAKKPKKEKAANMGSTGEFEPKEEKVSSKEQTFRLFKQGVRLEEIAKQRGYAVSTVEAHLVPYIVNGDLQLDQLVSPGKQSMILKALENFDSASGLTPIKGNLPNDISFAEIRYVLADKLRQS